MNKAVIILCILFLSGTCICAQQNFKGAVIDTIEKKSITGASVIIMRAKDSIILDYARTDMKGAFFINTNQIGKIILLITYPGYADYVQELTIKIGDNISLPPIYLTTVAHLLEEVIVKQTVGAIRIKGDTTEYKADSFHVPPNSTVEDLVKKLPGMQVDRNGNITANGKRVEQVLVDGEEFFGDDPTLVTRNIRADMVDKLQLYEKKSDQAAFTGIDDGKKKTTINVKLKENKKNGYFGKINLSGGTGGYHNEELMYNKFRGVEKFSAYAIVSNIGTIGLNWQDQSKYGDNIGNVQPAGILDQLDTWNGTYDGRGLPLVQTAGLHYNNRWNQNREAINANYKILQLGLEGNNTTNLKYILPANILTTDQTQNYHDKILRNRLNGYYEIRMDSTSALKFSFDNNLSHKETFNQYHTDILSNDTARISHEDRNIAYKSDNYTEALSILWMKKLRKKGRTISLDISGVNNTNQSSGYLFSQNNFYTSGQISPVQSQIIDQYKTTEARESNITLSLTYTEPISAYASIGFSYIMKSFRSNANINSFNKASDLTYTLLDTAYSNSYHYNSSEHRGGLTYLFIKKYIRITAGGDAGSPSLLQTDDKTTYQLKRYFVTINSRATVSYSPNSRTSFGFIYTGNSSQPTLQQIQPVKINTDPLNVFIGNAGLIPSFTNTLRLSLLKFQPLGNKNLSSTLSYMYINNAISSSSSVDGFGRNIIQSVNLNGNHSINGDIHYSFKLTKPNLSLAFFGIYEGNHFVSLVNSVNTNFDVQNYKGGISLEKTIDNKYDVSIDLFPNYTSSVSSLKQNSRTNFWSYTTACYMDFYLSKKTQFHTDINMVAREDIPSFGINKVTVMWNAWIGDKFLKDESLLIKVSVHNILNQNSLNSQLANANYTIQNVYSIIKQYAMLSIIWNFTKSSPNKK